MPETIEAPKVEKELNAFEADYAKYEELTVAEELAEVAPAVEEPTKEEPEVEAQPTETKPVEETRPVEEAAKPEEQKAPVKVEEKRSPALTNEQYLEEVRKKREELLPKIQESYQISDEDAQAFAGGDIEPIKKALSSLAANLYLDAFEANQMLTKAQLPGMVKSIQEQVTEEKGTTGRFYESWPELKDEKHFESVRKIVGTYRSMNPKATEEEVITNTGAIAMQALGLQRNGTQTPATSKTDERPKSHQPANPGATGGSVTPPVSKNPYTADYELFKNMY